MLVGCMLLRGVLVLMQYHLTIVKYEIFLSASFLCLRHNLEIG